MFLSNSKSIMNVNWALMKRKMNKISFPQAFLVMTSKAKPKVTNRI